MAEFQGLESRLVHPRIIGVTTVFREDKPSNECPELTERELRPLSHNLRVFLANFRFRPRLCENPERKTPRKIPTPPEARRAAIGM